MKYKYVLIFILVSIIFNKYKVSSNFSSHQVTCQMKKDWIPRAHITGYPKLHDSHMKYRFEYPMVIVSMKYVRAAKKAWELLKNDSTALEAVKTAITWCEIEANNCSGVGYGKQPDESGEPTLDASLFDGTCVCAGAVGGMRRIKHSIKAAEVILRQSSDQVLLRDHATHFVSQHGLKEECIFTKTSECELKRWKRNKCQPNYWLNTVPDSLFNCGPYQPLPKEKIKMAVHFSLPDARSHDSMAVIAIDRNASIAAGSSSCGTNFKIPGRIGMAAIPGSGTYADNSCCACVAIGWGDHMVKYAPAALTCDFIRQGLSPSQATRRVAAKLWESDNRIVGALLAVTNKGAFGVACLGISRPVKYFHSEWRVGLGTFPYFVRNSFGARRYWAICNDDFENEASATVKYKKLISIK